MVSLNSHLQRSLLSLALLTPIARADLGIMVADPVNPGSTRYTVPGHSLVYLSGVCADSPIRARLCQPGEQGSVLSMYPNFHETQPYSWNLIPISIYLHGSPTSNTRLLYGSPYVKQALELHARAHLFQTVCGDSHCPQIPHSYWRELVAATVDRDVFLYAVHTTPAQDQLAVDQLNRDPNINHYNGLTNNCANFAASFINAIFPHSIHRDLLNDVGMMAPKSAARSFTRWALNHPELGFYSIHFPQQPGDIPRSDLARSGTETVIHNKKYLIPAIVLGDWELPTSIVSSYVFTGRFGLYDQYTQHPTALDAATNQQQADILGTPQEWSVYRERLLAIQNSPEAHSLTTHGKRFFPPPYATGTATVDASGLAWLTPNPTDPTRRVGIGSQNVLSPNSDPELAFQLILGRVRYALASKNRMRESMQEFRQDWSLLEQAQSRLHTQQAAAELHNTSITSRSNH